MKFTHKLIATAALSMLGSAAFAQAGETVKIAWIDPLSGLMAPVGSNQLKTFQFFAEKFNPTIRQKLNLKSSALITSSAQLRA